MLCLDPTSECPSGLHTSTGPITKTVVGAEQKGTKPMQILVGPEQKILGPVQNLIGPLVSYVYHATTT